MYRILATVCLLALAAFSPFTSAGQSCTAYLNATDGDPGNPGTSPGLAKRSIEDAFNGLESGTVVCMTAGEYFFDGDSDGITLSSPGKSITFVLNAFGGEDSIRLSEGRLVIDAGLVTFKAGTASAMVLGAGVRNVDLGGTSPLLNFLHSVRFGSGAVAFEGVAVTVESIVGVPGAANPDNPSKVAPQDAGIFYGDASIAGALGFEPAPRSIYFTSASERADPPLPADLTGASLIFQNSGRLTLSRDLDLGPGNITLDGAANLRFAGSVSTSTALSIPESFGGSAVFESTLDLSSSDAAVVVDHRGTGSVDVHRLLTSELPDTATPATVQNAGGGRLGIEELASHGSFTAALRNLAGLLELGSPTEPMVLSRGLLNSAAGQTRLLGPVQIRPGSSEDRLGNSGVIDLGPFDLELFSGSGGHAHSGTMRSAGGALALRQGVNLAGRGPLPLVRVLGTDVVLDAAILQGLSLDAGAEALFTEGQVLIDGPVSIGTGAAATFRELEVRQDVVMEDGLITADLVTFEGALTLEAGSLIEALGLAFAGTVPQLVRPAGAVFPALELGGVGVEFLDAFWVDGEIRVEAGAHRLGANVVVDGPVTLVGGTLLAEVPITASFGGLRMNEAADFALPPASELTLGGDLLVGGTGTLALDGVTLLVAASLRLNAQTIRIEELRMGESGPPQTLTVASALRIASSLTLNRGIIGFTQGGSLELLGNLTRTAGAFDSDALEGHLEFSGSTVQRVEGFDGQFLPDTRITGAGVQFASGLEIRGSLSVLSGTSNMTGTTQVTGSLLVSGGLARLGANAALTVAEDAQVKAPGLSGGEGSWLQVAGSVIQVDAGSLALTTGRLVLDGVGDQALGLPDGQVLGGLALLGTGSVARFVGSVTVTLKDLLQVGANDQLDLAASNIQISPPTDGFADVANNGVITQTTGKITLRPAARGSIILGGVGTYGSLTIEMDSDDRTIQLKNGASLRLSGTLDFVVGGIELGQGTLELSNLSGVPAIHRNLADIRPANGTPDGMGLFSDGIPVGPTGIQIYDLAYYGSLTQPVGPGVEFGTNVRALAVTVVDALNEPPVFGFQIATSRFIRGSLKVGEATLLRLDGGVLASTAIGATHVVNGLISGTGTLEMAGSGQLTSANHTARIDHLRVTQVDADSLIIRDVAQIDHLEAAGSVQVEGTQDTFVTEIPDRLEVLGGRLTASSRLEIGTGSSDPRLTLAAGHLIIAPLYSVYTAPGTRITADAASSIQVGQGPESPAGGGRLVLSGNSIIDVVPPIPRLELAEAGQGSLSDDLFLARDLVISESLDHVDGDIFLGSNRLVLDGARWTFDNNGVPFDGDQDAVFGQATGGSVEFIGAGARLDLGTRLSLVLADLRVHLSTPTDTLTVSGNSSILQNSRQFAMEAGVLDLGFSDLILAGVGSDVFRYEGGEIIGSGAPVLPAATAGLLENPGLFPFDNDAYGELVIGGSGATVSLATPARVQNLRLRGDVRLPSSGESLTVTGRLAFGRNGATLFSVASNQLQLGQGVSVVRQGRGVLTHNPLAVGFFDLFYDLDDGDFSGENSLFGTGILSAGNETRALVAGPRNLGILAGGPGNAVDFTTPISLSGTLVVYSGGARFATGALSFKSGGALALVSLDELAPATLTSAGGFSSSGAMPITLSSPFSDLLVSDDLVPPGVAVSELILRAGNASGTRVASVLLQGDRTVGALDVRLGRASHVFNLNGRHLTVQGSAQFGPGIITSGPVAMLEVGDELILDSEATVQGAVSAVAHGEAIIDGRFAGLTLEAHSDVRVRGDLGANVTLLFLGSSQELALDGGSETIAGLTLAQNAAAPTPIVTISSTMPLPVSLILSAQLTLLHGILETGFHELVLPAPPGGFLRTGSTSHVHGTVRRSLPAGFSGTVVFPLGSRSTYRPFQLAFSGLLTGTDLSVRYDDGTPIGVLGLPLAQPGATQPSGGPAAFSWRVTSSVNFARSIAYDVLAGAGGLPAAPLEQLSLIMQPGGALRAWTAAGTLKDSAGSDGPQLRGESVTGGLLPSGTRYAIGFPGPRVSPIANLQAVHLDGSATGGPVDFYVENVLGARLGFGGATAAAQVALAGASTFRIGIRPAGFSVTAPPLSEEDVTLGPNETGLLALVPGGSGLAIHTFRPALSPGPVSAFLVNGVGGGVSSYFSFRGAPEPERRLLPVGDGFLLDWPQGVADLTVQADGPGLPEFFRVDLSSVPGGTVVLAASGTHGDPDRPLQMRAILPDGSVIAAANVTATTSAPDLPTAFSLRGNYPNPFNPVTTIGFDLPRAASVVLRVYDVTGRLVATQRGGEFPPAAGQTLQFDGSRLASGMYLYRLEASAPGYLASGSGRLVLMK